jgi:recombination protein RecA
VKDADQAVGSRVKVKVVKNKVAPPFQEAELDILYGSGISRGAEVLELGVQLGLIEKAGSYFSWKGERIGQGRERAIEWLKEKNAVEELAAQILAAGRASPPTAVAQGEAA